MPQNSEKKFEKKSVEAEKKGIKPEKTDKNEVETAKIASKRALLRNFPEKTEFVKNGAANIVIIYGTENKDLALELRSNLLDLTGVEFPMMLDSDATGGKRWTLKDDVKNKNLLLLGNINNNRGILGLYAKFLAAANGEFPGPEKYVIRHLAEPFIPGKTALVLGASDKTGLRKATGRLTEILRDSRKDIDGSSKAKKELTLGFPFLEFGNEKGPLLDEPTGKEVFRDYADAAYVFYSNGQVPHRYSWFKPRSPKAAMKRAKEFMLEAINKDTPYFPVGGICNHYDWIRNLQGLRIIIAHGLLNASELRGMEEKLLDNALAYKDDYVKHFIKRRKRVMKGSYGVTCSRHSASATVGHYLLLDYLTNFAKLDPKVEGDVKADYAVLSKMIRDWNDHRIFRARSCGDFEALDCTGMMIYGFMHLNIEDFVDNGILENMMKFYLCSANNLWSTGGAGYYIGAYRGCHIVSPAGGIAVRAWAFFNKDYSLDYLSQMRFEKAGNYMRGFRDKPPMCLAQPDAFSLPIRKEKSNQKLACPFLMKSIPEPKGWANKAGKTPFSKAFSLLAFRDGWSPDDAFMSIKGIEGVRAWNVNTINNYTEFGARFLFGGSQNHENWNRSGISVDAAKYPGHNRFAKRVAELAGEKVAIFASNCEKFNGTSWQRAIIRRKQGYFIVFDDVTALEDGEFNVTDTWRVLPFCEIRSNGALLGTAVNGSRFTIIPAGNYESELSRPAVDGVSRPTFFRQLRDVNLTKGESISFQNAITAAKKGDEISLEFSGVINKSTVRISKGEGRGSVALAGTKRLPGVLGFPAGDCAVFYMTEDSWFFGGVSSLSFGGDALVETDNPVDLQVDFNTGKAKLFVRDNSSSVSISPKLSGTGKSKDFAVGEYTFDVKFAAIKNFNSLVMAQPALDKSPVVKKDGFKKIPGIDKKWSEVAQKPPASVIRPLRISSEIKPVTMAVHNVHDGVFPSSSIPSPTWKIPEITLTIEQLVSLREVFGMRILGDFGDIRVKVLNKADQWVFVPMVESVDRVFDGYSNNRVGGRMFDMRRYNFKTDSRLIKVCLTAGDKDSPRICISEIQLLGPPAKDEVWGRLKIAKFAKDSEPVLLCRTGSYADTVESGGALQAFSLNGKRLWCHEEPAPSQYRGKYWLTGDIDDDGAKELVTYSDDTVVRIYDADGKLEKIIDLREWEEKNRKKLRNLYLGGKSIALWPKRPAGNTDIFVFGHVHHHQIQLKPEVKVTRRDRKPNIQCAPAASVVVEGWTGPGKRNLVGIAPYTGVAILWEDQGPDQVPRLVTTKGLGQPLDQPSANNQLPVFIECLKTQNPEGVLAVASRGMRFFSKPDLEPKWLEAGMCPVSAVMLSNQDKEKTDRVIIGRKNGRVLIYDVANGNLLGETMLHGEVRRIAQSNSGDFVVGTTHGVFLLKKDLSVVGFMPCPLEDLAVFEKENERIVYILSTNGELSAFKL